MITKEEYKKLWTINKCLSYSCITCVAGVEHTPKAIIEKFKKLSGREISSYCSMRMWFRNNNYSMDYSYNFMFKKMKYEDI